MKIINSIGHGWKIAIEVLGILGVVVGMMTYLHESGGKLSATMNGHVIESNSTRDVVVFMDETRAVAALSPLYPTFSNSSSYSIRDFSLKYQINATGMQFLPTDYYKLYDDGGGVYTLKYDESVLPGYRVVENPIKEVVVSETGAGMTMTADVTYDGCEAPYRYTLNARYIVVPDRNNLDFEQWKQVCQRRYTQAASMPAYYIGKGFFEYSEAVDINKTDSKSKSGRSDGGKVEQLSNTVKPERPENNTAKVGKTVANVDKPGPKVNKNVSKPIETPLKVQDNLVSYELTVREYESSENTNKIVDFKCVNLDVDSLLVICYREDGVNSKKAFNRLAILKGNRKKGDSGSWVSGRYNLNSGAKLTTYGVCQPNRGLRDSVKVDRHKIYNETRRTIAGVSADGKYGWLIEGHVSIESKSVNMDTLNLQFYEVPRSVLIEKYEPLSKWPKLSELKIAFWVCLSLSLFVGYFFPFISMLIALIKGDSKEVRENKEFMKEAGWIVSSFCILIGIVIVGGIMLLESLIRYYF